MKNSHSNLKCQKITTYYRKVCDGGEGFLPVDNHRLDQRKSHRRHLLSDSHIMQEKIRFVSIKLPLPIQNTTFKIFLPHLDNFRNRGGEGQEVWCKIPVLEMSEVDRAVVVNVNWADPRQLREEWQPLFSVGPNF